MLTYILDILATSIGIISLFIIIYGVGIALFSFVKNERGRLNGTYSPMNIRKLRASFGTYLLLGLEFLIASDIIKTVLDPAIDELIILAGVVVIRTVLSVFLNKEIKELEVDTMTDSEKK